MKRAKKKREEGEVEKNRYVCTVHILYYLKMDKKNIRAFLWAAAVAIVAAR